jgi:tripartite ATP-independent transporter DctM subunit
LPKAFVMGAAAILSVLLYGGPGMLGVIIMQVYSGMILLGFVAIPLFIFIACMLEVSGIGEDLYQALRQWVGHLPGGLAIATVLACTVIAAISGVSTAGVVVMGVVALPPMLRQGYDKSLCLGSIMAGGALGILIPPSVVFILYGMLARVSIGWLFAGGLIPGLMLACFYIIYIAIRCRLQPHLGPPLPLEERVSLKEKVVLAKGLIMPVMLIVAILGSILFGIASPLEAAAVGSLGAIGCMAIKGRLNWETLTKVCYRTLAVSSMIMWIVFGAKCFSSVFITLGASHVLREWMVGLGLAPLGLIFIMMLSYLILGCFVEEITMLALTLPIYLPILIGLGLDPIWFGVLFMVNIQIGYLTPPFGYCLFYMMGVAPPGITTEDVYRSILPYIALQWVGVLLVMFFPQLALWLPGVIFGA